MRICARSAGENIILQRQSIAIFLLLCISCVSIHFLRNKKKITKKKESMRQAHGSFHFRCFQTTNHFTKKHIASTIFNEKRKKKLQFKCCRLPLQFSFSLRFHLHERPQLKIQKKMNIRKVAFEMKRLCVVNQIGM